MITAVTTHLLPVFKLFYEHKLHDGLKENLIIYADREDSSEYEDIVDLSKTKVFNRSDIIKYYGDLYLPNAPYCKKMYFLNMISEMGLINDDLYMTDDDVLVYDESFYEIKKSDKIIHDRDTWPKVEDYKNKWPIVYKWYKDNMGGDPLFMMATNFFIPKKYAEDFSKTFVEKFSSFIRLIKSESDYIDKLNKKSSCNRNCDFSVFYLEVPFFDDVFTSLDRNAFERIPITCVGPSELGKIRDKFDTTDTKSIMEKFVKKSPYPKRQPLVHFNFANKEPLMNETFNYLNNRIPKHENINDLLIQYPKEKKKLEKLKTKSLF
jgi:hypothetical protein